MVVDLPQGGKTFVIAAETALYLNLFVGLVQAFNKIPALKQLAPTQTENPFKLAQLGLLATFIVIGSIAAIRFRGGDSAATCDLMTDSVKQELL